jgi:hypothetical protein
MPRELQRAATTVLSLAMLAIGIALVVEGLIGRAGAAVLTVVLGCFFIAAGAGRLYLLRRGGADARRGTGG